MTRDKKIIIIISQRNFCDEEYHIIRTIFESFGIKCEVASSDLSPAIGMEGSLVQPDIQIRKIKTNRCDALCFIGGVGCTVYWHDTEVQNLILAANEAGLHLGAICLAPVILANTGLLKGKRATAYPSAKSYLKMKGILYSDNPVETEKNIVTAKMPEAAEAFALKICSMLARKGR